jgi:hypothetical protein
MNNFWENKKFVSSGFRMDRPDISSKLYPRKAQPFIMQHEDKIFIYYEIYDDVQNWEIGVLITEAKNFPHGKWENYEKILVKSNEDNAPDKFHVADPVVIYHNNQFHMWFDMCNLYWTLGHATSKDGINWNKQKEDDKTAIILNVGKEGSWDDM